MERTGSAENRIRLRANGEGPKSPTVFAVYPPLGSLLIPQRLDRIEVRRPECRQHSAHDSYQTQNYRRNNQHLRRNDQPDVTCFSIFGQGAVKRQLTNRDGDDEGQQNSAESADSRNHHGFREELEQNISPPRSQGFFYPNFASSLRHGYQHHVHQTDSA